MNPIHSVRDSERGMTLVEVLIAIMVLTAGVLAMGRMIPAATRGQASDKMLTQANAYAQQKVEVLHHIRDTTFAEDAFQTFLRKYPTDRLAPDAQVWLGESLFQRQRYDAAAEAFLAVSTKHEGSAKAADSLLRLGQSLAALNQKEMACATLAEVGRKYPRASTSVKQGVEREQKRARC